MSDAFRPKLLEGIERFNSRRFWDAHESWEEIWLEAEGENEQFLQGLIQIAAAYHHLQRGTFPGGIRLFESGLRRLAAYPEGFQGVERAAVERAARNHAEWAASCLERNEPGKRLAESDYPFLGISEMTSASNLP